jgi:hypothetical protein
METPQKTLERRHCDVHTDRPAVERCASCGRAVCLDCAVPVRGEVLCTSCAAREAGVPTPPEPSPQPVGRVRDLVSAGLLGTALMATVPPWDRFGALTSLLSAWRPEPQLWPLMACLLVAAAALAVAARLGVIPVHPPPRAARLAYGVLALLAGAAAGQAVLASPDYVTHTPAPYVVLAAAVSAGVVGLAGLRRRPV